MQSSCAKAKMFAEMMKMIRADLVSLNLDDGQLDRLEKFYRLVIEQNCVMNHAFPLRRLEANHT